MSDLTHTERRKLERFFIDWGYVLDFSNRTFREFVQDSVAVDIETESYCFLGTSKGNRLRAFWQREDNHVVAKLLRDLLDYGREVQGPKCDLRLYEECGRIVERLRQGALVVPVAALSPNTDDPDFRTIAREVRAAIERNELAAGLDRLHTFTVHFLRRLCDGRGVTYDRDTTLHALFGMYGRKLREDRAVESAMSAAILSACGKTLDAFNDVRNNRSLAHANPLLGNDEARYIFAHVCVVVEFLETLEAKRKKATPSSSDPPAPAEELRKPPDAPEYYDGIPF